MGTGTVVQILVSFGSPDLGFVGTADHKVVLINNGPRRWPPQYQQALRAVGIEYVEYLDNPGYLPSVLRYVDCTKSGLLDDSWIVVSNADVRTSRHFDAAGFPSEVGIVGPRFSSESSIWVAADPTSWSIYVAFCFALMRFLLGARLARIIYKFTPLNRRSLRAWSPHGSCFAIRKSVLQSGAAILPMPRLYFEEWWLRRTSALLSITMEEDNSWIVHHVGSERTAGSSPLGQREFFRLISILKILRRRGLWIKK